MIESKVEVPEYAFYEGIQAREFLLVVCDAAKLFKVPDQREVLYFLVWIGSAGFVCVLKGQVEVFSCELGEHLLQVIDPRGGF